MAKRRRRKMTAKQLKYFGPKRRSKRRSGRSRAKVVVVSANPKRRRRRSGRIRRRAVATVSRRRFRRNPLPSSLSGFVSNSVMPAAIGAGGALAVDYALANLVPASMISQNTLTLWRLAGAFGVGMLVSMAAGEKAGSEATAGALTVAAYNMARNYMSQNMPSVALARYLGNNQTGQMGFVQRQRLNALGARRMRRLQGLGPVPNNFPGARSRLGAGNPNNVTKFRILRDGSTIDDFRPRGAAAAMNGLGFIGPGRTLGRYLGKR